MRQLTTFLFCVAFVIASPVLVPVAFVLHARHRRQMRALADKTSCERCGATFGTAALELADAKWNVHVQALFRDHPSIRFRLARSLWAICPTCRAEYGFDDKRRVFNPLRETYRDRT